MGSCPPELGCAFCHFDRPWVRLTFPDRWDPWVRGRLERPGGRSRYEGETLTTFLLACGRGMPAVDDTRTTYVLDRHAVNLERRHLREVTEWFRRRWRAEP